MNITTTKKAAAIIATFNEREKSFYDTALGYISEDMKHILNCTKEIEVYENKSPEKYRQSIKQQTNLTFRAAYLLQCFGLYVYDNFETMQITVKTINDK